MTDAEGVLGAERLARHGNSSIIRAGQRQRLAQRDVELGPVGEHDRAAHLGYQLGSQLLLLALERCLELAERCGAQRGVVGPTTAVSRSSGGGDGPLHVGARAVGHRAEHLIGGRVDVVERGAALGVDELAVDQQPGLVLVVGHAGHHTRGRCSIWRRPGE